MKPLAGAAILMLSTLFANAVVAQSWTSVSPEGEKFSIQMPKTPTAKEEKYSNKQFNVEGHVYSVTDNNAEYRLWALTNRGFGTYTDYKSIEGEDYLDGCADLVWDGLLKPWRDQIPKNYAPTSYLLWSASRKGGELLATDYLLFLESKSGFVRIIVQADKIYVLLVMNAPPFCGDSTHFIDTFSLGPEMPALIIVAQRFSDAPAESGALPDRLASGRAAEPSLPMRPRDPGRRAPR